MAASTPGGRLIRSTVLLLLLIVSAACISSTDNYSAVFDGTGGRWVDLTRSFSDSTIY